jgi:hypothetical protein
VRWIATVVGFASIFGTVGCQQAEPPSAIVQRAQDAGAGDLSTASTDSVRQWLGQHRPIAVEIDKMCAPVRGNTPANWGDTTEGRLCTAARQLAFTNPPPGGVKSDGRTFRPGTH